MGELLIYGATGYTGAMAAAHARELGLNPVLGGRNADTMAALADRLDCTYRVFEVDDRTTVDEALSTATLLLNCAGPYVRTWRQCRDARLSGCAYRRPRRAAAAAADRAARGRFHVAGVGDQRQ